VKVGDFVGWSDTWEDKTGLRPAGIVLAVDRSHTLSVNDPCYSQYLILYQHNGQIAWEFGSDLEVMFESR